MEREEEPVAEGDVKPAVVAASSAVFLSMLTTLLRDVLQTNPASSGLPPRFCASLLRDDASQDSCGLPEKSSGFGEGVSCCADGDSDGHVKEGVPMSPHYRHLAASLQDWISTGCFPRNMPDLKGLAEDVSWKLKIDKWSQRVGELGSTLLELLQKANYEVRVQEPYYSFLKDGKKTVEGRCASGFYTRIQAGDYLLMNQSLLLEVKAVRSFSTFRDMLAEESLDQVLPGVSSVDEGVQVYRRYYSEQHELKHGVLAFHVKRACVSKQPNEVMQVLLSELNVEGLRALLGLRETPGSLVDCLPPARSTLLSSFLSMYHDDTASSPDGCKAATSRLTVGARALAKHAHRSSSGWWGICSGKETMKNELALKVVCRIINHATWINIHHLPPAFPAFEIRVAEGYGSRWSANGKQFRGFLEPPMDEGHQKKWRH